MFAFAAPVSLTLSKGELLAWHQGRVCVRVLSGMAWVTRPNDPDDHFLRAGQTLELRDGLIGAETELCLRIETPRSSLPRIARLLAAVSGKDKWVRAELSCR